MKQSDFYLLPNILTLSRVFAIPLIAVLLYNDLNIWGAVAFAFVGITDYLDGWIARKYNYESKLGMLLDPLCDKIIILSTMIMLMWVGRLNVFYKDWNLDLIPPFLVIVTVGREIAITGLRSIASSAGILIPADKTGKLKTWIQFVAIIALLSNLRYFLEVGQFLLFISVVVALISGVQYCYHFFRGLPA
jgi:CDP-diacylglycerol--glycerol-3-phosphate 3-phosphatidyltransferase